MLHCTGLGHSAVDWLEAEWENFNLALAVLLKHLLHERLIQCSCPQCEAFCDGNLYRLCVFGSKWLYCVSGSWWNNEITCIVLEINQRYFSSKNAKQMFSGSLPSLTTRNNVKQCCHPNWLENNHGGFYLPRGNRSAVTNCRPVRLTSVGCKQLEQVIAGFWGKFGVRMIGYTWKSKGLVRGTHVKVKSTQCVRT
jgi:hypothetical protein